MKQCPQCKHTYSDELKFCLADGGELASLSDSLKETTITPPPFLAGQTPQTARQGVSPLFAYLSVGLFTSLIGGAIVVWMIADLTSAKNENFTNGAGEIRVIQNTKTADYPESNRNNGGNIPVNSSKTEQTPMSLDSTAFRSEVKAALDGWLQASSNRDPENHMKYYADRLETYYRKNDAGISFVRNDKQNSFQRYSVVDIKISNLKIDVNSTTGQVVTTFDKTFDSKGKNIDVNGAVQSQLRWMKNNGVWKIISEKDLRIYYVNKQ